MTINILLHQTSKLCNTCYLLYITPNHVWKTPYTSVKSALIWKQHLHSNIFFCSFSTGTPVSKKVHRRHRDWQQHALWQCERGRREAESSEKGQETTGTHELKVMRSQSPLFLLSLSLSLFLCVAKGWRCCFRELYEWQGDGEQRQCASRLSTQQHWWA